jgi:hypothetical protein
MRQNQIEAIGNGFIQNTAANYTREKEDPQHHTEHHINI